ncbi:MAG: ribulose-phosphate 3-epimerase [Bacilli bacterium]
MEEESRIRPSLLSADFLVLDKELDQILSLGIQGAHYDVMDGTFVDSISFGEPILKCILSKYKDLLDIDVHLMTVDPLRQARRYAELGARKISFHKEVYKKKRDYGKFQDLRKDFPQVRFGLAFNPSTDVETLYEDLSDFDFFLVMSVVPGKGGQAYIPGSEKKIHTLDQMRKEKNLTYTIEVDGGINAKTGALSVNNGADYLVAGSYYFHAPDRKKALVDFHKELGR